MQEYNPAKIESKWQKFWEKTDLYKAKDFSKKPKIFLLVEFPYPSGAGLHVGHCRSYTALDIIARKKRMEGYNVLFPMGWDAFGLPTENYAIRTGIHPKIVTKQNTAVFKRQQKQLGLSFDWSREINTTDPDYYKWTQRIFLKLFEKGLTYKAKIQISWCLSCKIGLANEEVIDGKCERCGGDIEKREKEQWLIKITRYAQRLIDDLDLVDFPEKVKISQREWIGRSEGWEIKFQISPKESKLPTGQAKFKFQIEVFTTRMDTIFGCTYLVVAPEHEIIANLKSQTEGGEHSRTIANWEKVEEYIEKSKKKSELDRMAETKEKTGVKLEGVMAINPANGKEIPIFVADYVLAGYGTGAIMAVPAHDSRDVEFAFKNRLPLIPVVMPKTEKEKDLFLQEYPFLRREDVGREERIELQLTGFRNKDNASVYYTGEGILFNSGQFDGIRSEEAREKIGQWLAKKGFAEKKINYKLRDWVFSRQRYWGEPIPLVFCDKCGWVAIPEQDLPVELPDVKDYNPTNKGESPLAKIESWVNTKCPKCKGNAKRETDVMPNWAGSNWYYLAYAMLRVQSSPKESKLPTGQAKFPPIRRAGKVQSEYKWDKEKMKYWMPVDWYNGGMEHTTLHLLYSRFIYKFLWDIGDVPKELSPEPYKKRTSHGMILGEGKIKMSKSKCNVINPETVAKEYGSDALRVYEMFMGPFEQAIAWDTQGVKGVHRFLVKIYKLQFKVPRRRASSLRGRQSSKFPEGEQAPYGAGKVNEVEKLLQKTIKKVSEDIEQMKFNTAVSALMIFVNEMEKEKEVPVEIFKKFLLILSPFAPHLAEEINFKLQVSNCRLDKENYKSIFEEKWPEYNLSLIQEEKINLVVQVNGRVRDVIEVERGIEEAKAKEFALQSPKIKQWLYNKEIKKVIFVQDKLLNFVVDFQ